MRWRDWISEGYSGRDQEMRPEFRDGATPERLAQVEAQLGCPLPAPLRELLADTDGVRESMCHNGTWFEIYTPAWSCDEIVAHHQSIQSSACRPPASVSDSLKKPVYFASAGTDGVLFAFMVIQGGPLDLAIYGYFPIEGEWRLVSPSLEAHMHGWQV